MNTRKIVLFNTDGEDTSLEQKVLHEAGYTHYEVVKLSGSDEAFFAQALDADAVVITYANMSRANLARFEKLKIIAKCTIGYDNVDLEAATERQIYVTNVPDYCVEEVATHTVALALGATRRIRQLDIAAHEGRDVLADGNWYEGPVHRLSTQVYGIVSFGNIGKTVARMMQGLGVSRVIAYDPFAPQAAFDQCSVERAESLEALLQEADIISLHTPLTPQTYHMIGAEQLKLMQPHACMVNVGRGGLIDEAAAAEALNAGQIGSIATDVLEDETSFSSPLNKIDNVIITPHTAFYSEEAVDESRIKPIQEIIAVLEKQESPRYQVNAPWQKS